jgi:hypothetical protein
MIKIPGMLCAALLIQCAVPVEVRANNLIGGASVDQAPPQPVPSRKPRAARVQDVEPRAPAKKTLRPDGTIVEALPDGSMRLTRPGVCGWTTVAPDGKESKVVCNEVQVADPPGIPDAATAGWLEAHNQSLLAIIRALLGQEEAVGNYLKNYENPTPTLYRQISLRTDTIIKLTP